MNKLIAFLSKYKFFIMSIILAVLVIILINVIIFFNIDTDSSTQTETTVFNPESLSEKANGQLSGDSRFLVICQEMNSTDVAFMTLVDFKIFAEQIIITPLDYNTATDSGTFKEKYKYGGMSLLLKTVETERNINIDRYVIINKDGFCDIIDMMGEVNLYVDEKFTYISSDKSYEIGIGDNTLESPMLYSYLKLKYHNADDTEFTKILCKIVNLYLDKIEPDEALSYFEDLSNCVTSDLSISDFYSAETDINYLINGNTICIPYFEGDQ